MPKVWVVGGDGGMGDIGYQNMSKVMLQNRPNVKVLMLDTQVYSNTGGQNSDSTPMLGGNDMNVFGSATQGKNTEKKTVAETFLAGHGSPFVGAGFHGQRAQTLPRDSRRSGVSRHHVHAGLHHLPAGARRCRRHGSPPGTARARLARRAGVRLQPAPGRDLSGGAGHQGQSVHRSGLVRDQSQDHRRDLSATPWRTGAPRKRASATT